MKKQKPYMISGLSTLAAVLCSTVSASTIDPVSRHAWSENSGWLNFADTNAQVRVFNDHLEGYAWSENVGWIRLGSYSNGGAHNYGNTSKSNWGVNNDAENLSGYAWSENAGWINFAPTHGGVSVDPDSGLLDGYAWSENLGWIHVQNSPTYALALQSADLSVTKEASSSHITPGDDLVYTITVTNNGPGIADNLVIQDTLAAGLTYKNHVDSDEGWRCDDVDGTVTCSFRSLLALDNSVLKLTVSTSSDLEEEISNTALASLYGPDADDSNNAGTALAYIGLGDMSCSGYDAMVARNFDAGMHLCVGRNSLITEGDVNLAPEAVVYFQSPSTEMKIGFKVAPEAVLMSSTVVGNVAPYLSGPSEIAGDIGSVLIFADTHNCEDYEDGALIITPADTGVLEDPAGTQEFTLSCTDSEKTTQMKVTVVKE